MTIPSEEIRNARRKAMQLLEHMDRTEKALSDRLRQAGFSERAVADAMSYVKSTVTLMTAVMQEPILPIGWRRRAARS